MFIANGKPRFPMTLRNADKTGNDLNLIITATQSVVNCGNYVFYRT